MTIIKFCMAVSLAIAHISMTIIKFCMAVSLAIAHISMTIIKFCMAVSLASIKGKGLPRKFAHGMDVTVQAKLFMVYVTPVLFLYCTYSMYWYTSIGFI